MTTTYIPEGALPSTDELEVKVERKVAPPTLLGDAELIQRIGQLEEQLAQRDASIRGLRVVVQEQTAELTVYRDRNEQIVRLLTAPWRPVPTQGPALGEGS